MNQLNILIVDDEKRVRDELDEFLSHSNHKVFQAGLPSEAFEIIDKNKIDIVILDIRLPEMDGLTVLAKMKSSFPDMEIIIITGHGEMHSVIQAMRSGASDYLLKPFRLADVQGSIERTQKFIQLNRKLRAVELNYALLSKEFHNNIGYHIIGDSPAMKTVMDLMAKVAEADDTTVLITGESGTGKELAARSIHYLSPRKHRYFYPVNVSAVPHELFESEFFGHIKGAFTGAAENKVGWFETAHTGTLFMDEICDLKPELQTKLLRILEDKKVVKIGSREEIPVNVRVIAATNRNIRQLVHEDKFRADLYHRINTFEIHIPPLKERKTDIPLLLENFVSLFSRKMNKPIHTIDHGVEKMLMNYDFPGNVRELKNMAERAVILCEGDKLYLHHFSYSDTQNYTQINTGCGENFDLEAAEKILIKKALRKTGYNKSGASELLNISWQSLNRRIKKYGLEQ